MKSIFNSFLFKLKQLNPFNEKSKTKKILTTCELKKYKNKIVVFSVLDEKCTKEKSFMAKLVNVDERLLFEFNRQCPCSVLIEKVSTIKPFFFLSMYNTILHKDISYARTPTEQELKQYKNEWMKLMYPKFFNHIKPRI